MTSMRFVFLLLLALASGFSYSASFDCFRASTDVERIICGDTSLSTMDGLMGTYFQQAVAVDEGIRDSQREWLKERDACADSRCLVAAYRIRIDVLERVVSQARKAEPSSEEPAVAMDSNTPDSTVDATQIAPAEPVAVQSAGDTATVVPQATASSATPVQSAGSSGLDWKTTLVILLGTAGLIVWKGMDSACPQCNKWFSRRKVGAEKLDESRGFKTVNRTDQHKDKSGRTIKTVHRKEQIGVINRTWRIYYKCGKCQHEWTSIEKTQSEG